MIKFFRNIRQQLVLENKTSKYLKYAIGEIVLVMVGILLALQINNWNEARKDRVYEVKMLNQVKKALEQDYNFFTEHLLGRRHKTQLNAVNFFRKSILQDSVDQDSVDFHFNRLLYGLQVTYNRGPYDALKSSGLDRISNDSLRNRLIYVYDFIYPRYEGLINSNQDNYFNDSQSLFKELSLRHAIDVVNDSVRFKYASLKPIDLRTDLDFAEFLGLALDYSQAMGSLLQRITPVMKGLIELIDQEINQLNQNH